MTSTTTARAGTAGRTPGRASTPGRDATLTRSTGRRTTAGQGRGAQGYGGYVSGANALQIGYADPVEFDQPGLAESTLAPPLLTPPSRRTKPASVPRPRSRPTATPMAAPVTAPLPIALPRAPFLVLIVALVVAGVLGVLVLNTKINENAFELDNLRAQQNALNLQEQQLAQQLADKESTGNLAAEAARLGLVPAGTAAFLSLPDGRVIGVPQPAPQQQTRSNATTSDPGR